MATASSTSASEHARDEDIRDSLLIIRRQRTGKMLLAIGAIIVALVAASAFVYLAYSSEPGTLNPAPSGQR